MLVYANNFSLTCRDSSTIAFRSIAGWLERKTGRSFSIPDILSGNEFRQGIYQVRTYAADKREPQLYSVLLTHRDDEIYGRFWSTEISVRLEENSTFISILLETQEISTRITEIPVTTRPALVNYLAHNAEFVAKTVGLKLRNLSNSDEDYKALDYEIKNPERDYPLVLVSCFEGQPLVDPEDLQKQLFGLAQVIFVDESSDSRKMARILGPAYSAWDGAVNIIFPYLSYKGFCYRDLIRQPELEELRQEGCDLLYDILARVTHSTNWLKRRQHFSPVDVRAKRQKDYLLFLREQIDKGQDNTEMLEQMLADADRELQEQKEISDQLLAAADEEREKAEEAAEKAKNEANTLRYGQKQKVIDEDKSLNSDDVRAVFSFFGKRKDCTPEQCLDFAEQVLPDDVVILDSAKKTAHTAQDFQSSHRLLEALWKLGKEFLPAYLAGGDNKTEGIFSRDTYAANESEQTMNNPRCKAARTFSYKGEEVTMWQHLGWGVADNTRESLRLYFYIDQKEGKIVIGHCGEHLPTIQSNSV